MMIAMIAARTVEVSAYYVVSVVPVRHSFMSAGRSMFVHFLVGLASMIGRTLRLISTAFR